MNSNMSTAQLLHDLRYKHRGSIITLFNRAIPRANFYAKVIVPGQIAVGHGDTAVAAEINAYLELEDVIHDHES